MDQSDKIKRKPSPRETSNIVSLFTFFYTIKIFIKGLKRDLEEEDIYAVCKQLKSTRIGDRLEKIWLEDKKNKKKSSLWRVIWLAYGKRMAFLGLIEMSLKIANTQIIPWGVGKLVSYFSPESTISTNEAYAAAAFVVVFKFVDLYWFHNYLLILFEFALLTKIAFCSLIYRKCLRLSPAAQADYSTGKVITLMTKDVQYIDYFVVYGHDLWLALLQICIISYNLYSRIGVVGLVGPGILLTVLPIQIYLGKKTGLIRLKYSKKVDARLQATQETLSAIKIIKMYTWEKIFSGKISEARKQEVTTLRNMCFCYVSLHTVGIIAAQVALYSLLTVYTTYDANASAENVFYIISSFGFLIHATAINVPFGSARVAELITAVRRISGLLNAEELLPKNRNTAGGEKPKIEFSDMSCCIKDTEILKNITCRISSGLNIITGPLGSGKSSFMKVILEDYPVSDGNFEVQGKISYASQEPWLFPGTIKQNILFGEKFNQERYNTILEICALKYDLDILKSGDETILEDNGMNLSKGQQARINLARAIYRDSDIYLLDDCLAALDVTVQEHIFKKCIKEFLGGKICICVTHNVKCIAEADQIIVLCNGVVKTTQKPSEISEKEIEQLVSVKQKEVNNEITEKANDKTNDEQQVNEKQKLLADEITTERNLYREVNKKGGVSWLVYKRYFDFGGGILVLAFIMMLFVIDRYCASYKEKTLSNWVNLKVNVTKLWHEGQSNTTEYITLHEEETYTFKIYTIALGLNMVALMIRDYSFFFYMSIININLHKSMIKNVLNATMEFFDNTFIGNILNRFSRDLSLIDEQLVGTLLECMALTCEAVSIIWLISTVNTTYLIPSAILCVVLLIGRYIYMPAGRSIKRLESATRSPVIGHLNASLVGLSTIRSSGRQPMVIEEFDRHQDLYTSASHMSIITQRGFGCQLNLLSVMYLSYIILDLMVFNHAAAGDAGLALTKSLEITGLLQWGIRCWANLENILTSVERVLEYTDVKSENKGGNEIENWPKEGRVTFDQVSLTYEKTNETVLKNLSFTINPREKIGIVGRTGAGKSSIIGTLFRLYNMDGNIIIDDVNCRTVAVNYLRSRISIIPQDPVLFRGTVRSNIDPKSSCSDNEIWKVFDVVKLKDQISDLDFEILDGETEFSAGQRQLFCLARALIQKNKVIVLDEATANMDPETDVLINQIIKDEFSSCTVLTIAHKLSSILNSDKIMVMDKGQLIEFGEPHVLLRDSNSKFYEMVQNDK